MGEYIGGVCDRENRHIVHSAIGEVFQKVMPLCEGTEISRVDRNIFIVPAIRALKERLTAQGQPKSLPKNIERQVAEEVDMFLPKCYWKYKMNRKIATGLVLVYPKWDMFKDWTFSYGRTRKRLTEEAKGCRGVYGADGKRISQGQTVYGLSDGKAWKVDGVTLMKNVRYRVRSGEKRLRSQWLTHKPPEEW